jgi:hypothetical protein
MKHKKATEAMSQSPDLISHVCCVSTRSGMANTLAITGNVHRANLAVIIDHSLDCVGSLGNMMRKG